MNFKCPICGEVAYKEDLRMVDIKIFPLLIEKDKISFSLNVRKKDETTIYDPETGMEKINFSQIMQVNREYLKEKIINQLNELQLFYEQCNRNQEIEYFDFIDEANKLLDTRLSLITNYDKLSDSSGKNEKTAKIIKKQESYCSEDNIYRKTIDKKDFLTNSDFYYFIYQEKNGQMIFIHPIDYKYLMLEYQSSDYLPVEIETKILSITYVCLSKQVLTRYKYNEIIIYLIFLFSLIIGFLIICLKTVK